MPKENLMTKIDCIKVMRNVRQSNLSQTDKDCISRVFQLADRQRAEIERLREMLINYREFYYKDQKFV